MEYESGEQVAVLLLQWIWEGHHTVEAEENDELIVFWVLSLASRATYAFNRQNPTMIGDGRLNFLFSLGRLYHNPRILTWVVLPVSTDDAENGSA